MKWIFLYNIIKKESLLDSLAYGLAKGLQDRKLQDKRRTI